MDSGTTIVAAITILICTVPFVVITAAAKRKAKKKLQEFMDFAAGQQCTISRHANENNTFIGIDDQRNIIFFHRQTPDYLVTHQVDLREVAACRVVEDGRTVNSTAETFKVIDRIALVLAHRTGNRSETTLELYNSNYDRLTLSRETSMATEWADIINGKITALKAS